MMCDSINFDDLQGLFVAFVHANSPASLVGLRFGDQILQINGENVAGWDTDKAMNFLKKALPSKIVMALRDRSKSFIIDRFLLLLFAGLEGVQRLEISAWRRNFVSQSLQ